MKKFLNSPKEMFFLNNQMRKRQETSPLLPYDENTVRINDILKRHWNLIEQDDKLKKIWPEKPFLALQRHKNLADL